MEILYDLENSAQLICVFVFAYAKSRFSQNEAQEVASPLLPAIFETSSKLTQGLENSYLEYMYMVYQTIIIRNVDTFFRQSPSNI